MINICFYICNSVIFTECKVTQCMYNLGKLILTKTTKPSTTACIWKYHNTAFFTLFFTQGRAMGKKEKKKHFLKVTLNILPVQHTQYINLPSFIKLLVVFWVMQLKDRQTNNQTNQWLEVTNRTNRQALPLYFLTKDLKYINKSQNLWLIW